MLTGPAASHMSPLTLVITKYGPHMTFDLLHAPRPDAFGPRKPFELKAREVVLEILQIRVLFNMFIALSLRCFCILSYRLGFCLHPLQCNVPLPKDLL